MGVWNGSIVTKSYESNFVSLKDMTAEMWRWLDYENLRETARNKLAAAAKRGIKGFYDVNVIQKAGPAKTRYLVPATEVGGSVEFENTPDVDDFTEEARRLDDVVQGFTIVRSAGLPWEAILTAILLAPLFVNGDENPFELRLDDSRIPAVLKNFSELDARMLADLIEEVESGTLDNYEDIDAALMVALYLYDKYPYDLLRDIVEALEQALSDF